MNRPLSTLRTSRPWLPAGMSRARVSPSGVSIVLALCAGVSLPVRAAPLPVTPLDGVTWAVVFPWVLVSLPVLFLLAQLATPLWHRSALCRWAARLRFQLAIDRGVFMPGYQPVVCARSGLVGGAEVVAYREGDEHRIGTPPPRARLPEPHSPLTPMAQAAAHGLAVPLLLRILRQAAYDVDITPLPRGFRLCVTLGQRSLENANVARACHRLQRVLASHLAVLTLVLAEADSHTGTEPPALSRAGRRRLAALRASGVRLGWEIGNMWGELSASPWPTEEYRLAAPDADCLFDDPDAAGDTLPDRRVSRVQVLAGLAVAAVVATGVDSACQRTWLLRRGVSWQQGEVLAPVMPLWAFASWLGHRTGDLEPARRAAARRYNAAR